MEACTICHSGLQIPTPKLSSYPSSTANLCGTRARTRNVSVRASISSNSASNSSRRTLSSNWDVRGSSSAPAITPFVPWLPRFEELDTTEMMLRQRTIFLASEVNDEVADLIISQLLYLDAEDPTKDIKIFINSPGGSITAGMGIYDTMKLVKADISTVCFGLAASMGTFILCAGTKGKRFIMPNARVMIHEPLGGAGGTLMTFSIQVRELMWHKSMLNKIMSRITGKSEDQINQDTYRDNFMSSWEARDYGLVDEVIGEGKPGLVAPLAVASPPPETKSNHLLQTYNNRREARKKKNRPTEHKLLENYDPTQDVKVDSIVQVGTRRFAPLYEPQPRPKTFVPDVFVTRLYRRPGEEPPCEHIFLKKEGKDVPSV